MFFEDFQKALMIIPLTYLDMSPEPERNPKTNNRTSTVG